MSGTITVTSVPGAGASFTVRLPLDEETAVSVAPSSAAG